MFAAFLLLFLHIAIGAKEYFFHCIALHSQFNIMRFALCLSSLALFLSQLPWLLLHLQSTDRIFEIFATTVLISCEFLWLLHHFIVYLGEIARAWRIQIDSNSWFTSFFFRLFRCYWINHWNEFKTERKNRTVPRIFALIPITENISHRFQIKWTHHFPYWLNRYVCWILLNLLAIAIFGLIVYDLICAYISVIFFLLSLELVISRCLIIASNMMVFFRLLLFVLFCFNESRVNTISRLEQIEVDWCVYLDFSSWNFLFQFRSHIICLQ